MAGARAAPQMRNKGKFAIPKLNGTRHRLFLAATAALVMRATACAPLSSAATPEVPIKATDFEAAIARLEPHGPQSPEALNARLQYADFLSEPAADDCQQRLAAAQSQLDIVAASPAANVLLPLAPALIANGEYKIHLAHASCGNQPPLKTELEQALAAAQRAVGLYRDALDYQSAAIMQFNVAATDYALADVPAAIPALQAAIAMDREFGFREDAEDNTRSLLRWRGSGAGDGDVAALMKDFSARTAEFKFNWSSGDADVAISAADASVIDGKIVRSQGTGTLNHHVSASPTGWTVSNEPGNSTYEMGDWPTDAKKDLEWSAMYFLASALLLAPTIEIGRDGNFNSVADAQSFGTSLAAKASVQLSGIPSETADATLKAAFSPDFIESSAMQNYGIETGTWIGAKLEQGVWYQMSTPLFLSALGLGHYLVNHDISFAFTRQVPCTADAPDHLCAEIVVHATPDTDDLNMAVQMVDRQLGLPDQQTPDPNTVVKVVGGQLRFAASQTLHYWSMTDLRLVIDPDTLRPYVCDTRQHWYAAFDGLGQGDSVIESVRTVSTSVYH